MTVVRDVFPGEDQMTVLSDSMYESVNGAVHDFVHLGLSNVGFRTNSDVFWSIIDVGYDV